MTTIEVARILSVGLGSLVIISSLLPIIKSDNWMIRILDYPRSQIFWINAFVTVMFLIVMDFQRPADVIVVAALGANQIYLLTKIWRYTPFASAQMQANKKKLSTLKILIANVFQDNRDYSRCVACIKKHNPDIFMLVETDEAWSTAIHQAFAREYPHQVLRPQANTYGMVLYSKFEMLQHTVRYLVEADIPSVTTDIQTPDGQIFRLYCLHPRPPVPHEAEESTERDAEILLVGKEAKQCKLPVVVAGDLNDVAWSYTTSLFLKVSGLLDPRIGRGFYSTFHAKYSLLRWPLDHVFCSSHFYLHKLRRLESIESDHFPILIELALMPHEIEKNVEEEEHADAQEHAMANEKIAAAS